MNGREIYEIWAPTASHWSRWARVLPFIALKHYNSFALSSISIPEILYIRDFSADTAIILDLPDGDGVKESVALARLGWRPVPLYNGTNPPKGATAILDNSNIETALALCAKALEAVKLQDNAPPVFLLDSNRTHRHKISMSIFDNSWDIYSQDMPTADYLLKHGITKLIIQATSIQRDLNIILHKYQKKGLKIYLSSHSEPPLEIQIKKPKRKHLKIS